MAILKSIYNASLYRNLSLPALIGFEIDAISMKKTAISTITALTGHGTDPPVGMNLHSIP